MAETMQGRGKRESAAPRLSVIIVNWNSAGELAECLESLERETPAPVFEVIVVDNASFDGCEEMLRTVFPAVRFIQSKENLGFAGANNLGAAFAEGEVILFLNPDTLIHDQALSRMYDVAIARLDAGALGARLLNPDGSLQTSCVQAFPTVMNQLLDTDLLRSLFPRWRLWGTRAFEESGPAPVPVEAVSGACLMVRRKAFEQVGGFSNAYFMYGEDLDLCFRLARAGRVNLHCPNAVVTHLGGGSSKKRLNGFSAVMTRESVMRFIASHRGAWSAACYRILMGCSALVRLVLLAVGVCIAVAVRRRHDFDSSIRKWTAIWHWCWRRQDALARILNPVQTVGMQTRAKRCAGSTAS